MYVYIFRILVLFRRAKVSRLISLVLVLTLPTNKRHASKLVCGYCHYHPWDNSLGTMRDLNTWAFLVSLTSPKLICLDVYFHLLRVLAYFCGHVYSVTQHIQRKPPSAEPQWPKFFFRKELWYVWCLYHAVWVCYGKPEYLCGAGVLNDLYICFLKIRHKAFQSSVEFCWLISHTSIFSSTVSHYKHSLNCFTWKKL